MKYTTQIITTFAELATYRQEWNDLVPQSDTPHPFYTFEFTAAVWKSMLEAQSLHTVIVFDDNKIVGIAPLYVVDTTTVACIADRSVSDYSGYIVQKGKEKELIDHIHKHLKLDGFTTVVYTSGDTQSTITSVLQQAASSDIQDVVPLLELPSSWEDYLQVVGRKQRHEIRRKWRRIAERNHDFEVVHSADAIDTFIELHKLSSDEKRAFWNEKNTAFFYSVMQYFSKEKWLKLFFLKLDGKRVATMLVFDYLDTYYLYNSGYDPNCCQGLSTGNVLIAYTIQHAIKHKKKVYSFLRGSEDYKFRFDAQKTEIVDLTISL